tara:strand:- start:70005 stop:70301 length:297 start_codon:yes stop_codon:yes gene_type:complete
MKTELDIYMKVLQELGYRYTNWGNDLPNPMILIISHLEALTLGYPHKISLHYNYETGNVFKINNDTLTEMIAHDGAIQIKNKIKIELRNNNINNIINN